TVASSNIPNRGVFPFRVIWSLYTATFGQAIPSALRHFSAAATKHNTQIVPNEAKKPFYPKNKKTAISCGFLLLLELAR
ncbi:MAG: hypothetical protein RBT41_12585, partial [Clostridia bacterium]|nr:hypothetical protein [Clostridia bacterium]